MLKKINIDDLYNNPRGSNTNNNSQQKVLLRLEMSDEWSDGGFFLYPESMTHPDDSSTFHACVMSGAVTTKALADLVDADLSFDVFPYSLDEEAESYFVLYENGNEVTNKQKIIKILNSIFKVCYVIDSTDLVVNGKYYDGTPTSFIVVDPDGPGLQEKKWVMLLP